MAIGRGEDGFEVLAGDICERTNRVRRDTMTMFQPICIICVYIYIDIDMHMMHPEIQV